MTLEQDLERLRRYQAAIVDFGRIAAGATDLDRLFQDAAARVADAVEIGHAKVLVYRPEANDLLIVAGVGWKPGVIGTVSLPAEPSSPPGHAFLTGEALAIDNITETPDYHWSQLLREHGIHSLLNVPIKADSGIFGVLEVDGIDPQRFSEDSEQFLVAIAALLGAAIERCRAEDATRTAILTAGAERQLLLQELQHRVANNLQSLLGALYQGRREAQTAHSRALFGQVIERLDAMMEAHAHLTAGDLTDDVALGAYLTRLIGSLVPAAPSAVRVLTDIDEAKVAPEQAVTVSLVVNEIVTNALKHAFPDGAAGTIHVTFRADVTHQEGMLIVSDDGRGMTGPARHGSSGLGLITSLVQKLGGTCEGGASTDGGGTTYAIRFPLAAAPPRS